MKYHQVESVNIPKHKNSLYLSLSLYILLYLPPSLPPYLLETIASLLHHVSRDSNVMNTPTKGQPGQPGTTPFTREQCVSLCAGSNKEILLQYDRLLAKPLTSMKNCFLANTSHSVTFCALQLIFERFRFHW